MEMLFSSKKVICTTLVAIIIAVLLPGLLADDIGSEQKSISTRQFHKIEEDSKKVTEDIEKMIIEFSNLLGIETKQSLESGIIQEPKEIKINAYVKSHDGSMEVSEEKDTMFKEFLKTIGIESELGVVDTSPGSIYNKLTSKVESEDHRKELKFLMYHAIKNSNPSFELSYEEFLKHISKTIQKEETE